MIKIENINTYNWRNAIRGMRHPHKSYDRIDSKFTENGDLVELGKNDKELMKRLIGAGTEHRKFLRQVFVTMEITASLFWWKEMDTYKVGTATNSTSTMHTLHKKELELSDFSIDELNTEGVVFEYFKDYIELINKIRRLYIETENKSYWRLMIELLPSSYNQTRTWTGSYENLINIYYQRRNHKLTEWRVFCKILEEQVPFFRELILEGGGLE